MPRLLPSLRPFLQALPEVEAPDRKIIYRERLLWTGVVMLIFLVCCNLPLYGVPVNKSPDPFYWMRVMLASNRGTLMELGIAPIVTSGITMQVLSGWGIITVQQSKDDRGLFSGAQKFFGIVLCFVQAFLYVVCGTYGPVSELGFALAFIIGLQLAVAGCVVIILDELMQKGYGIGSGISLFIAANACENVVWKSFAPVSIQTARGTEYEGAVIAFFHLLFTRSDKARALKEAFTRGNLPNLWNVIITVVVFGCIVFFQGWRVELPIKFQKYRGQQATYPIKLFYTGNMSIIMYTALVSNIAFFSQVLHARLPANLLTRLMGSWEEVLVSGKEGAQGVMIPTSGLAYYISPPRSLIELFTDPFHALFYIVFVLVTCALFSKTWIEVSGSAPRDVAKQLQNQQMVMKGHRETGMGSVLNRYIPTAAAFGGMAIGAICVFADFMGAIGGGTGLILAVTFVYQYYELLSKEQGGDSLDALMG
mmetsp:Transcript_17417/g.45219  ORF Transcript_17417/g.45219 Transcript_17417/m.45219 type:complete len:479 (-) Transcript_17417:27-1463(-)